MLRNFVVINEIENKYYDYSISYNYSQSLSNIFKNINSNMNWKEFKWDWKNKIWVFKETVWEQVREELIFYCIKVVGVEEVLLELNSANLIYNENTIYI
jgi:hypothetical protein